MYYGGADYETAEHLFFASPFKAYIWKLCKVKLNLSQDNIGSLLEEVTEIKAKFSRKNNVYILARLAIGASIWNCWQERNRRIFQNQQLQKIMVFRRLYEDINVLMRTCNWKVGTESDVITILCNWGLNGLGNETNCLS